MRKVGDDHGVGDSSMFVYHDQIGHLIRSTGFDQFLDNVISSVDTI